MSIAVIIPCHNEEVTIGKVIKDFKVALPGAEIVVCDNASTDQTARVARQAGARVVAEARPGKGNAVRRLLNTVEADIYVMVDGDATYEAAAAPTMVRRLVLADLDMVIGARVHEQSDAYRAGHEWGNRAITATVNWLFGRSGNFKDVLSGYRVMSRRFVQSLPIESGGFDIETELNVHSLDLGLSVQEVNTRYTGRPEGSSSKLRTFVDGVVILARIFRLLKDCRPFALLGVVSLVFLVLSLLAATPVFYQFATTGLIPSIPSAILAAGLGSCSLLSLTAGLVLDGVARVYRRQKVMLYMQEPKTRSTGVLRSIDLSAA